MRLHPSFSTFIQTFALSMPLVGCGLCGNEIAYEERSPNGQLKAVVFERDCGATTRSTTQISILPNSQKLPNDAGNLWIAKGDLRVGLKWEANDRLVVTYPANAQITMKQDTQSHVSVRYESFP